MLLVAITVPLTLPVRADSVALPPINQLVTCVTVTELPVVELRENREGAETVQ